MLSYLERWPGSGAAATGGAAAAAAQVQAGGAAQDPSFTHTAGRELPPAAQLPPRPCSASSLPTVSLPLWLTNHRRESSNVTSRWGERPGASNLLKRAFPGQSRECHWAGLGEQGCVPPAGGPSGACSASARRLTPASASWQSSSSRSKPLALRIPLPSLAPMRSGARKYKGE